MQMQTENIWKHNIKKNEGKNNKHKKKTKPMLGGLWPYRQPWPRPGQSFRASRYSFDPRHQQLFIRWRWRRAFAPGAEMRDQHGLTDQPSIQMIFFRSFPKHYLRCCVSSPTPVQLPGKRTQVNALETTLRVEPQRIGRGPNTSARVATLNLSENM